MKTPLLANYMILAKLHELQADAMHYDEDLKIAYSKTIQDVLSGKIDYHEFLERTDTIQDEFRFRVMKALNLKSI